MEKFALRHCCLGSSVIEHINNKTNTRGFIKQIFSNVLCWIFAWKLVIDLIIFTKVKDKTIINCDGYFGNDRMTITVLSADLIGMISSLK